jgi:putative heme-binding domain-containing protein
MIRPLIFTACLVFIAKSSPAQLANQPPAPYWLKVGEAGTISATFQQSGPLLKAILLVAADHEIAITINDRSLGTVSALAGQPATSLDVTTSIREGENSISLATKAGGRAAAMLELNGDLARKRWVVTGKDWASAGPLASVEADPAVNPFDLKKTFDAYNSWQLAKPGAQNRATDANSFTLLPGFKAELIRSASPEEDSWVAMAFDPKGRITLAKEKKGLLRLTPGSPDVEIIDDSLKECRGLLYAHGALYANANNSKGLYRLTDANEDGVFEEVRELLHTEGGVGHGRNHLKLGPEGDIYVVNGNNVLLPSPLAQDSPLRNYGLDQLLPNPWDGTMFDGTVELPAGYILRVKPDGSEFHLIAGGLRNPLDVAFNREGEMFTYDADMERDVGASWYMPTRVLHVVPGADFGWRRGTGRFPDYYEDTLPSVVDIGLSSPTAINFGYGARFPAKYQEALYICDWTYGRIIAVHLKPKGASYTGTQETFISGRPLNVTDVCIGPDGAMWFTTGGRGTQSGLYRVTYHEAIDPVTANPNLTQEIRFRRRLESEPTSEDIVTAAASSDRFLRHAARAAMESQGTAPSVSELRAPASGWLALTRWLTAARVGDSTQRQVALEMALAAPWENIATDQRLAALRIMSVAIARGASLSEQQRMSCLATFEPRFPDADSHVTRELCRVLVFLKSTVILGKAVELLKATENSEDLLFYPLHLRYLTHGWTMESRRAMFEALNQAEKLNGASAYFKAIHDTRAEMAAALPPEQAAQLAAVIYPTKPVQLSPHALPGHTFKQWTLADLAGRLEEVSRGRSFERGRNAAITAQCVFCHKVSNDPTLPGGLFGPELVQVSARFNRQDLLDHILNPSKVIDDKFRLVTITKSDGSKVIGNLETEDDERVTLRPSPLAPDTVEIGKSMIRERAVADISPMPAGLLNPLKGDQILDLLAFLEAGGDPRHPIYQR